MNTDDWKSVAIGFLPGVVVGAALMWVAVDGMEASPENRAPDTNKENTITKSKEANVQDSTKDNVAINSDAIDVLNQPAGRAVLVRSVTLTATSWLAVRDTNTDGSVGNILGAVRRDAGDHTDIIVDLLRSTEPDRKYVVTVIADNGDGVFDPKTDTSPSDASAPIIATFTAETPPNPTGR